MIMNRLRKLVESDKCQFLSEMMAATPHFNPLPNTYKKNNAQDISTKKIIRKERELLLRKEESKHFPRMANPKLSLLGVLKPASVVGPKSVSNGD